MRFTKMQGLGNDYIYLDCTREIPFHPPSLARKMSDRHFGVGSDGLICVCSSKIADFRMLMYNADGSVGEMCGNGIRCVGKFVYDKGMTKKTRVTVETLAGVYTMDLHVEGGKVTAATVDMGAPLIELPRIWSIREKLYTVTPVTVGNRHVVHFLEKGPAFLKSMDLEELGPCFEHHPDYPDRVNAEFVSMTDPTHLHMRVWERGSGETMACGTGACAVLAAAADAGLAEPSATVELRGGPLHVRWDQEGGHIYMTGPAVTVFEGDWPEA